MPTSTTIAEVLATWISDRGGQINPRAAELGVSWETLRKWSRGDVLPKRRDLPAIATVTGRDLDELRAIHLDDLQRRVSRYPRRIDTVEEAQAWAATHAPATTGQDGAAGEDHGLNDSASAVGAAQ